MSNQPNNRPTIHSSTIINTVPLTYKVSDGLYIPDTYKKITFTSSKSMITMTPCRLLHIIDLRNVVIIYKIIYTSSDPEIQGIETEIPYYLSDGDTNEFKCNLLLPFLCFDDRMTPSDTKRNRGNGDCFEYQPIDAHDTTDEGMLFKLGFIKNMNYNWLSKAIMEQSNDYIEKSIISYINSTTQHGLGSVMSRMSNVLDQLIGSSLVPSKYTKYMCVPSNDATKTFRMDSPIDHMTEKDERIEYTIESDEYDFVFMVKEKYRRSLYNIIINIRKDIHKFIAIDVVDVNMNVVVMNSTEFNQINSICRNIHVYEKIRKYELISNILYNDIRNILYALQPLPKICDVIKNVDLSSTISTNRNRFIYNFWRGDAKCKDKKDEDDKILGYCMG